MSIKYAYLTRMLAKIDWRQTILSRIARGKTTRSVNVLRACRTRSPISPRNAGMSLASCQFHLESSTQRPRECSENEGERERVKDIEVEWRRNEAGTKQLKRVGSFFRKPRNVAGSRASCCAMNPTSGLTPISILLSLHCHVQNSHCSADAFARNRALTSAVVENKLFSVAFALNTFSHSYDCAFNPFSPCLLKEK